MVIDLHNTSRMLLIRMIIMMMRMNMIMKIKIAVKLPIFKLGVTKSYILSDLNNTKNSILTVNVSDDANDDDHFDDNHNGDDEHDDEDQNCHNCHNF